MSFSDSHSSRKVQKCLSHPPCQRRFPQRGEKHKSDFLSKRSGETSHVCPPEAGEQKTPGTLTEVRFMFYHDFEQIMKQCGNHPTHSGRAQTERLRKLQFNQMLVTPAARLRGPMSCFNSTNKLATECLTLFHQRNHRKCTFKQPGTSLNCVMLGKCLKR